MLNPLELLRSIQEESHLISWPFPAWKDLQEASVFTQINYTNIILLVGVLIYAILQIRSKNAEAEKSGRSRHYLPSPDFPPVQSLGVDFDYSKTEPIKHWHFKPKYHLTMAIQSLEPTDLLVMDKNYPSRIAYRREILQKYGDDVCGVANEAAISPAVRELYTFLLGTYLPVRFPRMFKLHEARFETGKRYMLENLVTGELLPASPISPTTQALTLLHTLCKTLDEDFFFLLPSDPSESANSGSASASEDTPMKYHLHAFSCCCPSGFSPRAKLGLPLAGIHKPVPGYKQILEGSMDRFFAKLEVGQYVKRVNWSITTHGELYTSPNAADQGKLTTFTHGYEGDKVTQLADIDVDQTFVRTERQTLHRLPKSKAIVFAFKTYLYPISQIKTDRGPEGAEEVAQAIDGLKEGNTPGMNFYKRAPVWAEAVKRYLRT